VVHIKLMKHGTYLNEELRIYSDSLGKIIIVDSGCHRSLMGEKELKEVTKVFEFQFKDECLYMCVMVDQREALAVTARLIIIIIIIRKKRLRLSNQVSGSTRLL
jgi:hypothetical protein